MCLTLFNAQNVSLCLLIMFVHFCVNHWGNWLSGCLSAPASTSSLLEGKHLDISAWPYSCPARVRLYSYSASLCGQLCVRVCIRVQQWKTRWGQLDSDFGICFTLRWLSSCQKKTGLFQLRMFLSMFIFAAIFPFECEHLVDNTVHREPGQVNKWHTAPDQKMWRLFKNTKC